MSLGKIASAGWRAQYNPLRGITLGRAVAFLEEGERGRFADLQWTYRFIEKRDATLRGLLRLRIGAIQKLDWDIKQVSGAESLKADTQARILRDAYEKISNLREAIAFLALAEFRGYSHLEKHYEGAASHSDVIRLEPVEQWHWSRDPQTGEWRYHADASDRASCGQAIDSKHFLLREVKSPINEIGLVCFLRKNLSQKDWDGFVEVYGVPPAFVEMPANTPQGKEAEYQAMAEAVIGDMRGTLPSGAKIQTAGDGARGINPFRDHLSYQDEQLVLAGTAGKLTMLAVPTGLGTGLSAAHQNTFEILAQAEAVEISEIFQRQFDRAILGLSDDQPALAYFQLAPRTKRDAGAILEHAVKAAAAGFRVNPAELSEKTGLKLAAVEPMPAIRYPTSIPSSLSRSISLARNRAAERTALEQFLQLLPEPEARMRDTVKDLPDAPKPGSSKFAVGYGLPMLLSVLRNR
ncbi:MAG: DUF935 family protein [Opitutaceae bacterium]|nr:DUF935 family protein [Opitutaceae bacterium]